MKPWGDPLRVGAGEQLCGRLTELQDLRQHGDLLVLVLDAVQRRGRKSQVNNHKVSGGEQLRDFLNYLSQSMPPS